MSELCDPVYAGDCHNEMLVYPADHVKAVICGYIDYIERIAKLEREAKVQESYINRIITGHTTSTLKP